MSTEMQTKVQASPAQNFTPVQTGLLQRKSALCNTSGLVEDSERDKEKLTLQRSPADKAEPDTVPPIVHEVLRSPGQPIDPETRDLMEPHFGHDFSRVRVHSTGLGMIQTKLKINEPGDIYEQEADRVAEQVMRMPGKESGVLPLPSIYKAESSGLKAISYDIPPLLQRQETKGKQKTDEEKYKEAAKKTGEAFLKTEVGTKIENKTKELGEYFISILPGKVITGAAAAGVVTALIAANEELPIQPLAIPLDIIQPGLSMKITYEGPVQNPTKAMITFSGKFDFGWQREQKRPIKTETEKLREENIRKQRELFEFREMLKSPKEKAQDEAFLQWYISQKVQDPTSPIYIPGFRSLEEVPAAREKKEEEEMPVQRKAVSNSQHPAASPIIQDVLHSPGQPLDPATRAFMEPRFGHDFSQVRVHTDSNAAESARAVNAHAFTLGQDVVFGDGQYVTGTAAGLQIIAHELTHTIQQSSSKEYLKQDTPTVNEPQLKNRNVNAEVAVSPALSIHETMNSPTIARQLDPNMCASDCTTPDSTGGSIGKYRLIIYADKEGPFLLLPWTHKVGHSWLKLVDTSGNYWTYGFWPQSGYDSFKKDTEGCVHHPDTAHEPTASQTFELTADEFADAKAKAISICSARPKYNLFGLQCTEFVRQVLKVAGKTPALGFGLIFESPNALDSWIRGNALMLGISVTGATSAAGKRGKGDVGLDITYTHRFFSTLGNKLRLHWMSRGEWSSSVANLSTGVGVQLTSQRVFLPSIYLFGGGIAGQLSPGSLESESEGIKIGAGFTGSSGLLYNIDEITTVGVEYNLVKDLINQDPVLHRFMISARLRLF